MNAMKYCFTIFAIITLSSAQLVAKNNTVPFSIERCLVGFSYHSFSEDSISNIYEYMLINDDKFDWISDDILLLIDKLSTEELYCMLSNCNECYIQYGASITSTIWASAMTIKGCLALGPGGLACIISTIGVGGLASLGHYIGYLSCLETCSDDQLDIEGPGGSGSGICETCIIIVNTEENKCFVFNASTGVSTEYQCVILPIP